MSDKNRCPILVLGIGNILLRDEGVGVRVIERLQQMQLPSSVEVVDGGTEGADLPDVLAERKKVIVVDAVDADIEPGAVLRFGGGEIEPNKAAEISLHDVGIAETLAMTRMLRCVPESVVFLGIKPANLQPGLDLSKPVADSMEHVIDLVLAEIAHK